MRKPAFFALLGVCLSLACRQQPSSPYLPPPSRPTTLHVAFDDIPAEKAKAVPMSLTSSTGAGLALVSLTGRAVIDDPLAFTELHLVFENPEDRVIEGSFSIVLPHGAALSRFAMRNDQGWEEGEVVEKKRARAAYEDFLHRRQDPALLEQNAGNEFTARVFPIPARGRKEIVVAYQHELTDSAPYVLPLVGLPKIGAIDLEAHLAGHAEPVVRFVQHDLVPAADFRVEARPVGDHHAPALRNGDLVVARVPAVVGSQPEPLGSALILVDTSASRALGMVDEQRIVAELCAAIGRTPGKPSVLVAAYDQDLEPIYDGPAAGFGADAVARLRQRLALGASDLGAALERAGVEAQRHGLARVVLVTDGLPTAGTTAGNELRAAVARLERSGVQRLDAVAVGGIRDDDLLKSLVSAGLPHGGVVVDGAAPAEERWRRLNEATRSGLDVRVEGAAFIFPRRVDGAQAGDEVIVYAQVPEGQPVRISVGGAPAVVPDAENAERPLLERAWVGAKIRSLLDRERTSGASEDLSREIVRLSTKYRVLSPKTALLVLETAADYDRFGIDRRSLTDILVADGGRVRLESRAAPLFVAKPVPARVVREDAKKRSQRSHGFREPAMEVDAKEDALDDKDVPGAPAAPEPPPPPPPAPEPEAAPAAPAPLPVAPMPLPPRAAAEAPRSAMSRLEGAPSSPRADVAAPETPEADPYTGPFKTVMTLLAQHRVEPAVQEAYAWRKREPGDVMALVALGEAFEAAGEAAQAARCYGSIIDLFPSRADLRRFAGERLERLPSAVGLDLALDTFTKAVEERPDHPASHRLYAYALLRKGQHQKAFEAIVAGLHHRYPDGRFPGVERILAEDVGLVGAAWAAAEPARAKEIANRVQAEGGTLENEPSIRFVLNWETDANDVDFHIFDAAGGHAFYQSKELPSGGELYADVTTGYGPECFTIRAAPKDRHGPYRLWANYYSRGPMGYGMGKLEIIEHDGKGGLRFQERPFVVMVDHGFVDLGTVER